MSSSSIEQNRAINDALKTVLVPDNIDGVLDELDVEIDLVLEEDLKKIIALNYVTTGLAAEFGRQAKGLQKQTPSTATENARILGALGLTRDQILRHQEEVRNIVTKRGALGGFEFETWEAWKRLKATALKVSTYYSNLEKQITGQSSEQALETAKIDVELARSERLKRFIADAERAEIRLQEVLNNISTLGVKSKALQQDAEAWQEKINQAERVVRRLDETIPGSGLPDEQGEIGEDLTVYQILDNVDALAAKFKAHEAELTTLKADWTSLERQAKTADTALRNAQLVQSRITPAFIAAQQQNIAESLGKLASIENSARDVSNKVAIIKKQTDDAEKNLTKATTSLSSLEERLGTLTATESVIAQAAAQVANIEERKIPGLEKDGVPVTVKEMQKMAQTYKEKASQFRPLMDQLKADWQAIEKDAEANEKISAKVATQMVRFDDEYFDKQRSSYAGTQAQFIQTKKNFDRLLLESNKVDSDLSAVKKTLESVDKLERGIAAAQERLNATADDRKAKFDAVREKQRALESDVRTETARSVEIRATLSEHTDKVRALDADIARQRENLRRARTELDSIERDTGTLDKDYNAALARTQKLDDGAKSLERKAERSATVQRTAAARLDTVAALSETDLVRAEAKYSAIETRTDTITALLDNSKEKAAAAKRREIELGALDAEMKAYETRAKVADRSITSSIARITANITNKAVSGKQLDSTLTQLEKIQQMLYEYLVRLRIVEPGAVGGAGAAPAAAPKHLSSKEWGALTAAFPEITVPGTSKTTVAPVLQVPSTTTTATSKTTTTATTLSMELDPLAESLLRTLASEVQTMGSYDRLRGDAEALLVSFTGLVEMLKTMATSKQPSLKEVLKQLTDNAEKFDDIINKSSALRQAVDKSTVEVGILQSGVDALNRTVDETRPKYEEFVGANGKANKALDAAKKLRSDIAALTDVVNKASQAPGGVGPSIEELDKSVVALASQVERIDVRRADADGMLAALTSANARITGQVLARTADLVALDRASAELEDALTERRNALILAHTQLAALDVPERKPDEPAKGFAIVDAAEFQKMLTDLDRQKILVLDLALKSGWQLPLDQDAAARLPITYKLVEREAERQSANEAVRAAAEARQAAEAAALKDQLDADEARVAAANLLAAQTADIQFSTAYAEFSRLEPLDALRMVEKRFLALYDEQRQKVLEERSAVPALVLSLVSARRKTLLARKAEDAALAAREEAAKQARLAEEQRTKPKESFIIPPRKPVVLPQQQQQPQQTTSSTSTSSSTTSAETTETKKPSGRGRRRDDDDDDGGGDDGSSIPTTETELSEEQVAARQNLRAAQRRLAALQREDAKRQRTGPIPKETQDALNKAEQEVADAQAALEAAMKE